MTTARLALATLLASSTFAVVADDIAKPEKAATCAACHGEAGVSANGMYPTIAGQYANYLEHSLKAYRSGARKNAIMGAQAVNLTDAEIKALSRWYAAQPGPLYTPSVRGQLKP
jgi:cytochrome c553